MLVVLRMTPGRDPACNQRQQVRQRIKLTCDSAHETGTHACMHAFIGELVLQTCSGDCTRPPGGGEASIFSIAARRCSALAPLNPARSMKLDAMTPAARDSV